MATPGHPPRPPAVDLDAAGSAADPDHPPLDPPALDQPAPRVPPLWPIFGITVVGVMGNTLFSPAIPSIRADLGISSGEVGLLQALTTLPGIVLAPVMGLLSDRFGRRAVLAPALLLYAISGGLAMVAPSYGVLFACRLAQGIGGAGALSLNVVVIADHWSGPDRVRRIGWSSACLTVCLAIMPLLGGLLDSLAGWRATFLPYWIGVPIAVALWRTLPPRPHADIQVGRQLRQGLLELRNPVILAGMLTAGAAFVLIFGTFYTALPIYAADEFGLGSTWRGLLLGFPAIGSTTTALLAGRFNIRHGARRVLLVSMALFAAAFAAMGLAPAVVLLFAGSLLYGAAEGLMVPTTQNLVAGAASDRARGMLVAVNSGVSRIGQTVGPVVTGAAVGAFQGRTTMFASAAFAAVALGLLAASRQPAADPV